MKLRSVVAFLAIAIGVSLHAGEVARADLDILGLGLEVDRNPVITAVDVPSYLQTIFGGKMNDEAPAAPGLSAIGELTGPGIDTPITLAATPGRKFALPALHEKGEYSLQNIRLVGENGEFLQQAVPSFAVIQVTEVMKTEVRARQLTPEELRERGINVDLRNYDVFEYTIVVAVGDELVEIPYPVIIDRRTNTLAPVSTPNEYGLPKLTVKTPPRFQPPQISYMGLEHDGGGSGGAGNDPEIRVTRPSIPAAIVVPTGFGVLHQFRAGTIGDPIKQIIHGDSAYDDPLETTAIDPFTQTITQLYPIYDEAAAGSLQAVLNNQGELVARNLTNDPYGADDLALAGAAIDGAKIKASKNAGGEIESVDVTLHATEQLDASTITSGARLTIVDASGTVVRSASTAPTLATDDPFAIRWALTAAEWNTLVGDAAAGTALSVAATKNLRASAWSSSVPVMPAPEWARATKPVYSSSDLPVEVRESLASLSSYLASIPPSEERTSTLYEVETLGLLGMSGSDTPLDEVLSAHMHAHPFSDPLTRIDYVRARWYDSSTGTFLSPDPKGYVDSSNLYAFAGGDPVNGRDPTGKQCEGTTLGNVKASAGAALGWVKDKAVGLLDAGGRSTVILLDDLSPIDLGWVTENAREARRYNNRIASGVTVAAERGELTPVHVIGGAAERHRQAVASADCSEGQAAASTVALLDLASLRGAVDVPTTGGGPKLAPALVTNTGAILPQAANATTASLVAPVMLASSVDTTDSNATNKPEAAGNARLRDERGRFKSDPDNPPSPYVFTDAQRRAAWKKLAEDPTSPLTEAERAEIKARGWRGPQRYNEYGELETMELSHEPIPLREGGTEVVPKWPDEHAAVDPHRHLKKR